MPASQPRGRRPTDWSDAIAIFTVAASIRLLHVLALRGSLGFDADVPPWDSFYYAEAASALTRGDWEAEALSYVSSPVYLAILWACFELFGRDALVPRLLQCVVGGLTASIGARIGSHVFDRRTGIAAGLMIACYGPAIFYDGELLKTSWALASAAAMLLFLIVARERGAAQASLAAGVSSGLLLLLRGNLALVLPVALVWLWNVRSGRGRHLAAFGIGTAVILGTSQLWVASAPDPDHFLSRGAGLHVYLGNHAGANGTYAALPGIRPTPEGHVDDSIRRASASVGRELGPNEASRVWLDRAAAWVRAEPTAFVALSLRKARLFANAYEIPSNEDAEIALRFSWVLRLPWLGFGVLAPLAVAGAWRAASRRGGRLLLGYGLVVFCSLIPLFVTARYRLPVLPALAVLAAAGAVGLWERTREAKWRSLAGLSALVLAGAGVVHAPTPLPRDAFREHAEAQLAAALGTGGREASNARRAAGVARRLLAAGDAAAAALVVERARREAPEDPSLRALAAELADANRPSILLVVVDTLRADHMPCYGYERDTAPVICSLAERGLLFERAFTPRPATTPALASLFTGLPPHRHGLEELYQTLPDLHDTLAERLARRGYRTGAFVSSFVMGSAFSGFAQGFDTYDDALTRPEPFRENFERSASETVSRAIDWLHAGSEPFFLFVHLIEPHGPYTPDAPHADAFPRTGSGSRVRSIPAYQRVPGVETLDDFQALYDGEIAAADAAIGRLLAGLTERGLSASTHVVVTADHGESFGEEDHWLMHGYSTHPAETRVPLLVRPAGSAAPRRIGTPVSLTDLFDTLLYWAGDREATPGVLAPRERGVIVSVPAAGPVRVWDVRVFRGGCASRHRVGPTGTSVLEPALSVPCEEALPDEVRARIEDLASFERPFPVKRHADVFRPGFRHEFVERRGDEILPLGDAERSRLRSLGYTE